MRRGQQQKPATVESLESCLISPTSMVSVFQTLTGSSSGAGDLSVFLQRTSQCGKSPFSSVASSFYPQHSHSRAAASKRPLNSSSFSSNGIASSSSPSAPSPSQNHLYECMHHPSSLATTTTTTAYGCAPFSVVHAPLTPLKLEIPTTNGTGNAGSNFKTTKKAKTQLLTCSDGASGDHNNSTQQHFNNRPHNFTARSNHSIVARSNTEAQRGSLESCSSSSSSRASRGHGGGTSTFIFSGPETSPEVLQRSSSTDSSSFIFTDSEQESDL